MTAPPQSANPLAREIDVAVDLARAAGRIIMGYYGTGVDVDRKAGDEPVTRADREASDLILAGLRRELPDDIFISEEAPDDPRRMSGESIRSPGARIWFIDPLDGTKDFIRGNVGFSVMIGMCIDGRPALGVVYQPIAPGGGDRVFTASSGHGSWMHDATGTHRLVCSPISDPGELRLVASKSHRTAEVDAVKSTLGIADEMNIGSVGLKLGLIALAERDLYVNPSTKSKTWDTCAPEVILVEAGGKITDLWGEPLNYDRQDMRNLRGLLASNGPAHDAVVAKLAILFPRPKE